MGFGELLPISGGQTKGLRHYPIYDMQRGEGVGPALLPSVDNYTTPLFLLIWANYKQNNFNKIKLTMFNIILRSL